MSTVVSMTSAPLAPSDDAITSPFQFASSILYGAGICGISTWTSVLKSYTSMRYASTSFGFEMNPSASESFPRKQAAWNVSFGSGQTSWPRTTGLTAGGLNAETGTLDGADRVGI